VAAGCVAGSGLLLALGGSCMAILSGIATSYDESAMWSVVMWGGIVMIVAAIIMAIYRGRSV
jgi:hypothetical protein